MKKIFAIILACLMALSIPVTCLAAGGSGEITGAAAAVNRLSAALQSKIAGAITIAEGQNLDAVVAGAYSDLEADAAPVKADAPLLKTKTLSDGQTLKAAAGDYAKYIFIPVKNADEAAGIIAESCEFTYSVVSDGKGTVYIKVNVEENPEIFNFEVFRSLVDQLYAGQNEEMIKNEDGSTDYLMSYEHIAAELALHMLVYAATSGLIELSGSGNETLLSLYNSAREADLNYDESRFPSKWMNALGKLIVTMFRFDFFRILGSAA